MSAEELRRVEALYAHGYLVSMIAHELERDRRTIQAAIELLGSPEAARDQDGGLIQLTDMQDEILAECDRYPTAKHTEAYVLALFYVF